MIDLTKIVKPGVLTTERRHFRAKLAQRSAYLRLDLNENLVPLSAAQFADMMARVNPDTATAYPDLSTIYRKLARHVGVGEDQLVITNGSDMAIKSIFDVCIGPGDRIVLHDPYFLMYERYAQLFDAAIDAVPVDAGWLPDTDAMLAKLTPATKMLVVEDPSGNVGTSLSPAQLEHLARTLEPMNVLLVIDEAYLYVSKNSSANLALVARYSNVILIRTMSKAYGLAGARLGMLITNPALAAQLYKVRSLYEISGLSANITEWHLDHPEVLAGYQATIHTSKHFLFAQMQRLGLRCKDTSANFVIVELTPGCCTVSIAEQLRELGILIGKAYSLPHLLGWARITVGTLAQCQQLVAALEVLMAQRGGAAVGQALARHPAG